MYTTRPRRDANRQPAALQRWVSLLKVFEKCLRFIERIHTICDSDSESKPLAESRSPVESDRSVRSLSHPDSFYKEDVKDLATLNDQKGTNMST